MTTDISNSDDVIDSRNVIERIEELEGERESYGEEDGTWEDDNADDAAELALLKAFAAEGEDYFIGWKHGVTLIRDSYWVKYAQGYADDIGAIDGAVSWPMTCIDWEQAARELQYDYSGIDFDGVTYWGQ